MDAVSALTLAAKFAVRVMQLVQQRKANLASADDLLKRLKSISHLLGLLEGMSPNDLHDLAPILEGVNSVCQSIEEYVTKSVADATGKSKLQRLLSIQSADNIKVKLEEADTKLSKYLALLSAAQGAKQLQQSRRIEDQLAQLQQLSSQMFAFSLIAQAQPQPAQPRRRVAVDRGRRTRSEGAKAPRRVQEEEEEDEEEDTEAEDEDEDDDEDEEEEDEEQRAGLVSPSSKRPMPGLNGSALVRSASLPPSNLSEPLLLSTAGGGGMPRSHSSKDTFPSPGSAAPGTGPRRMRRSTGNGVMMVAQTSAAAAAMGMDSAASTPERRGKKVSKSGKKKGTKSPGKGKKTKAPADEETGKPSLKLTSSGKGGVGGDEPGYPSASPRSYSGLNAEDAAAIDEVAAENQKHTRIGHYISSLAHVLITGYFVGALALMTDDEWKRVVVAFLVPFSPIATMLVCAWWAGNLKATVGGMSGASGEETLAGMSKTFLRNCWLVYRFYFSAPAFAIFVLSLLGAIDMHTTLHIFSEYLIALFCGAILFLFIQWLGESTPAKAAASAHADEDPLLIESPSTPHAAAAASAR